MGTSGYNEPLSPDSVLPRLLSTLQPPKGRNEEHFPALLQPRRGSEQPLRSSSETKQKPFSCLKRHLAAGTPATRTAQPHSQRLADAPRSPNRCLALGPPPRPAS